MKKLKIRKIGNSLGAIFPKEWEIHEGQEVEYKIDSRAHQIILDFAEEDKKHDRQLIEDSFADFEKQNWLSETEMKDRFGKFGWGK